MITTNNLSMRFQNETSIQYTDLRFDSGRSYCLLGASGCGKSTLLNLIAGVRTPTGGGVDINGFAISSQPQRARDAFRIRAIGYVFQDFKLIDEMSVADNINILRLEHIDTGNMDAMLEALGILGLKRRRVSRLSGGEKQRVAIARALIKQPEIILADEPTGNLNYEIGEAIVRMLIDAGRGKTLIAVTHDERLAAYFDEVLDMNAVTARGAVHA